MVNKENADKMKEVELTPFQKITTLEHRLSAMSIALYWIKTQTCFGFLDQAGGSIATINIIRGGDIHGHFVVDNGVKIPFRIPMIWLNDYYLHSVWVSYLEECKYSVPKEIYEKVTKGLV